MKIIHRLVYDYTHFLRKDLTQTPEKWGQAWMRCFLLHSLTTMCCLSVEFHGYFRLAATHSIGQWFVITSHSCTVKPRLALPTTTTKQPTSRILRPYWDHTETTDWQKHFYCSQQNTMLLQTLRTFSITSKEHQSLFQTKCCLGWTVYAIVLLMLLSSDILTMSTLFTSEDAVMSQSFAFD